MKAFLEGLLPRILPEGVAFRLIPHEGKSDLESSIPRKLRGWREPGARFVVVRDQDSGDCREVKARVVELCHAGRRPDVLVRIACRELEAWYLADLAAVDAAYGTHLASQQGRARYRAPDALGSPSTELKILVPAFQKVSGGRALGPLLDVENRRSPSFAHLVSGVLRLAGGGPQRGQLSLEPLWEDP